MQEGWRAAVLYMCEHICRKAGGETALKSVLSSQLVGSGDPMQSVRLGGRHLTC